MNDLLDLETILDKNDWRDFTSHLADICRAKAEHLRVNWQDESTARCWERRAAAIEKASKIN